MKRTGFSLVELLVVIVILAILASLALGVLADNLTNARIQATKATIRLLDGALQERLEAFGSLNLKPQAQQLRVAYYSVPANAPPPGVQSIGLEFFEALVRKDRFRAAFPQRFEDLCGLDGAPGIVGANDDGMGAADTSIGPERIDFGELGRGGIAGGDSPLGAILRKRLPTLDMSRHQPDTESSELLYLVLTEISVFGASPADIDRINPNHIGDTDGDGLREFLDDWGNPLRFYNWPTRLVRPGGEYTNIDGAILRGTAGVMIRSVTVPNGPLPMQLYGNPLNQDPDDFTGVLALIRDQEDFNGNGSHDTAPVDEDFNGQTGLQTGQYNVGIPFGLDWGTATTVARPLREEFYHTLNTYHTPLIVSAGPDGNVGLHEPNTVGPERLGQPLTADDLTDNLTNRQ